MGELEQLANLLFSRNSNEEEIVAIIRRPQSQVTSAGNLFNYNAREFGKPEMGQRKKRGGGHVIKKDNQYTRDIAYIS